MHVIELVFETGNRSQVSLPLKLQKSDGALLEKGTIAFALKGRRKAVLKRIIMMELEKEWAECFFGCAGSAR